MFEPGQFSNYDSYLNDDEKEQEQEQEEGNLKSLEYKIKSPEELIKSYYESEMDEKDLYEMVINNDIALNLYQSLFKLKKGADRKLFKYPCQIKVYPKIKIMVIYIIVSHNFLRIKTELVFLKENKKYKKPDEKELKMKINSKSSVQSQESQSININKNQEMDNESNKENEIIFTVELNDFYNMLDLLLCQNKDHSIVLCLDRYFSVLTGKSICSDVYYQIGYSCTFKFNLLKNEVFSYVLDKHKNNSKKNFFSIKTSNKKTENNNENYNDNNDNNDNDKDNDLSLENSESESKNNSNSKEKENQKQNNNNQKNNNESQNIDLQKKFTMELNSAKYIIEGSDLSDLYCFMKGIDLLYDDFSTNNIEISLTNDKAFILCPNMQKIKYGRYIESLSKNINQQIKLNIKSVINHSFTPLAHGFNSFYRTKFISKFITSFYNKNDKRLLIKVSPSGKMILSYTFSDPKNDLIYEENNNENNNIKNNSEEINEDDDNTNEEDKKKNRKVIKDRLLDDENRGNIVEMIFYTVVFGICKS
jgi:hypothetical protein